MKDTFRGCGGHVQNFRSSGVGTGGDPTHRLTCRGDPLIVYAGHRNESPGRRDPKELCDPTRNPSFLGGGFLFSKVGRKNLGARPVHCLGGGGTTPGPTPAKRGGWGRLGTFRERGGERARWAIWKRERKPHNHYNQILLR